MKRNDIKKLHQQSVAELDKLLIDLVNQLAKARLEKAAHKLENTSLVKTLSTDIARVKTIIKEKKLEKVIKEIEAAVKKVEAKKPAKEEKEAKKTKKTVKKTNKAVKKDSEKK